MSTRKPFFHVYDSRARYPLPTGIRMCLVKRVWANGSVHRRKVLEVSVTMYGKTRRRTFAIATRGYEVAYREAVRQREAWKIEVAAASALLAPQRQARSRERWRANAVRTRAKHKDVLRERRRERNRAKKLNRKEGR